MSIDIENSGIEPVIYRSVSKNSGIEPVIYRSVSKNSYIEPALLLLLHTVLLLGTVFYVKIRLNYNVSIEYQTKFRYRSVSNKTWYRTSTRPRCSKMWVHCDFAVGALRLGSRGIATGAFRQRGIPTILCVRVTVA